MRKDRITITLEGSLISYLKECSQAVGLSLSALIQVLIKLGLLKVLGMSEAEMIDFIGGEQDA